MCSGMLILNFCRAKNNASTRYHRAAAKKRFKNTVGLIRRQKSIVPSQKHPVGARRVAKQPSRRAKTTTDVQKRAYGLFSPHESFLPRQFERFLCYRRCNRSYTTALLYRGAAVLPRLPSGEIAARCHAHSALKQ